MKTILLSAFILASTLVSAQTRALFIGNSYTNNNNLPQMVKDIASNMGDSLITDKSTPGGYTLQNHSVHTGTVNKVKAGNWDYVVLQEQSQIPSLPDIQMLSSFYPYSLLFNDLIKLHSPCAKTVMYMTWGRKNGDATNCATWPPVCTYKGMDDLIRLRYRTIADSMEAMISPVGAVWRYIINKHPAINLYMPDESHPDIIGTYAAACTFYTVMFHKDPTLITFDASVNPSDAIIIRNAVKKVVYDSLPFWNVDSAKVAGQFTYQFNGDTAQFYGYVNNADTFYWDINGTNYDTINPRHTFTGTGPYYIQLFAIKGCDTLIIFDEITKIPDGIETLDLSTKVKVHPNPASNVLYVQIDRELIGETLQLYSSDGKLMLSHLVDNESITLNTSVLSEGLYFLNIRNLESSGIRMIKSNQ